MKPIVSAALICVIVIAFGATSSGAPAPKPEDPTYSPDIGGKYQQHAVEYFLNTPISAFIGRDNVPWGENWICVKIFEENGKTYISLWNVMTKIGRWLVISPVRLHKQPLGKFEFKFKDNWDNGGVGYIEYVANGGIRLDLKATTPSEDPAARNALGQYGTVILPQAACPYMHFLDTVVP